MLTLAWLFSWFCWLIGVAVVGACVVAIIDRSRIALHYAIEEQRFGIRDSVSLLRRIRAVFLDCGYVWFNPYDPCIRWRNMTRRSDYERYQREKQKGEQYVRKIHRQS